MRPGDAGQVTVGMSSELPTEPIVTNGPAVTYSTSRGGQEQNFTFKGSPGEVVTLAASGGTFAGTSDISIQINDPSGNRVSDQVFLGNTGFTGETPLSVGGTYTVNVVPYSGDAGTMLLRLSKNLPTRPIVANGPALTFKSTRGGQGEDFTFSGIAGEHITITATGGTFPGSCDIALGLIGGDQLGATGCVAKSPLTSSTTLTVGATYRIDLVPMTAAKGSLTIKLSSP
jgi:hypothetical protein